jgi:hypothetical protein
MSRPVHNLPAPRTSLIGREQDVAETCALVLQSPERLVTLTGVGAVARPGWPCKLSRRCAPPSRMVSG